MPAEIDFSKGVRGKFYRPGMRLRLPIYLDDETQRYLADRAQAKGVDVGVHLFSVHHYESTAY
ncbi:MAG: hypothetical protein H7232_01495 [Aeromicrobium sp.]|nr:hypothetical protein [Burkholderiales bacterium]